MKTDASEASAPSSVCQDRYGDGGDEVSLVSVGGSQ